MLISLQVGWGHTIAAEINSDHPLTTFGAVLALPALAERALDEKIVKVRGVDNPFPFCWSSSNLSSFLHRISPFFFIHIILNQKSIWLKRLTMVPLASTWVNRTLNFVKTALANDGQGTTYSCVAYYEGANVEISTNTSLVVEKRH